MTFLRKHNPKFGDVRGDTYLIVCMCIGQYTWQEFKVVCFYLCANITCRPHYTCQIHSHSYIAYAIYNLTSVSSK